MRPIDADALLDALYDNEFQTLCPLDEVSGVIAASPTLDYAPVRRGEWVHDCFNLYRCSKCREREVMNINHPMRFCPNCGAKMDGGKKDV